MKRTLLPLLVIFGYATLNSQPSAVAVPAALLSQVGRSPIEFAALLAGAAVPGGIEIKDGDASRTRPVIFSDNNSIKKMAATDLATEFNRAHADYRAAIMGKVFVIRPVNDRAPLLDSPSPLTQPVSVTGRMMAARQLFGLHGASVNTLGYEGEDVPIVLDNSWGPNLIDALNGIVMQSPSVWQVTTRKEGGQSRIVSFGFIRHDGTGSFQGLRTDTNKR